jgi:spermidine synthase
METAVKTHDGETKPFSFLFPLLLSCFFISGFTGLIYEILWTKLIVKVIGSAPFSVSIVLTVFMGGLGLGSYLAGKKIDKIRSPLTLVQIYGGLELIIAVYGLLFPLLLIQSKPLFSLLYNQVYSYFWMYNLITFFGCFILLIIPVTCMGATLPVLCRFFITNVDRTGTNIGRLYGLNTIGAALGSLICGFWLIDLLGVRGALLTAVFLNSSIGAVCLIFARNNRLIKGREHADDEIKNPCPSPVSGERSFLYEGEKQSVILALVIFAISGFSAMAYEVIWIKLLGIIIGPTTYSFTIVLVTFITCLALGSLFFGRLADRVKDCIYLLLLTQIFAAISALLLSQLMGNSQIFFSKLIFHFKDSFTILQIVKGTVLFVFMFIPTFCLGATFPLVGKICTRSLENAGRTIGSAYAINTIGAVLGSFSAGFILIPILGKENSIRFVSVIQLFVPLIASILFFKSGIGNEKKWIPLFVFSLTGLFLITIYPNWDRRMLSTGKYHRSLNLDKKNIGWMEALFFGTQKMSSEEKNELVYFGDGIGGFTTVMKSEPDIFGERIYSLYNSGKADASSSQRDMFTQVLLAHFPMLFHPDAKDVLVLGLASGITSGEILHYPVDRLDTIEINQQVIDASNFFIPWNNNLLKNPKTNLIIQDGRAHLELSDQLYDVIISEPSNPWMAGLASLFTQEFMELAKNRLKKKGIYVQWLHSYQMDWPTFQLVGRTFSKVFPNSLVASTHPREIGPDFLLVGFADDYNLNPEIAKKNFQYAGKSTNMKFCDSSLIYHHILSEDLSKLFDSGNVNTDNFPLLEYSAPKLLYALDSNNEIAGIIQKRSWLREETKIKLGENFSDINKRIDYLAYLLSFQITFPKMDAIPNMSQMQKKRVEEYLMEYCRKFPLPDFSFISDPEIRNACIRAHLTVAENSSYDDKASVNYYMGFHCLNNNMNDDALKYFTETIKFDPENAAAHFNMGYLLFKQQRFLAAATHFEKVLQINPSDPQASDFLKKTKTILSKFDLLLTGLKKKAENNPNDHLPYYSLATVYMKMGDFPNAILFNNKALSIKPDFINALNSLAFIYSSQNEYGKSIEYFKKMIEIQPFQPSIYYNIACLYSKQNRIEDSIGWLNNAIQKGYNDWNRISTDQDLSNIRNTKQFFQLKEKYSG